MQRCAPRTVSGAELTSPTDCEQVHEDVITAVARCGQMDWQSASSILHKELPLTTHAEQVQTPVEASVALRGVVEWDPTLIVLRQCLPSATMCDEQRKNLCPSTCHRGHVCREARMLVAPANMWWESTLCEQLCNSLRAAFWLLQLGVQWPVGAETAQW